MYEGGTHKSGRNIRQIMADGVTATKVQLSTKWKKHQLSGMFGIAPAQKAEAKTQSKTLAHLPNFFRISDLL